MKTKKFLPLLLAFLLSGCFDLDLDFSDLDFDFLPGISLHPLYTDEELIFEEKLLGVWSDGETKLVFKKNADANSYDLICEEGEEKAQFTAHLVKFDDMLFLDMAPTRPDTNSVVFSDMLFLPGHIFMKIETVEPELHMRFVYMLEVIENDPNLLKHEVVKESNLVITASPKELQKFLKDHADDEELFEEPNEWGRVQPKDPNDPNTIDPNQAEPNSTEPDEN